MRNYKISFKWPIVAIGVAVIMLILGYQIGHKTASLDKLNSTDKNTISPIVKLDKKVSALAKQKHDPLAGNVLLKSKNKIETSRRSNSEKTSALIESTGTMIEQDDYSDDDIYDEDSLNEDFVEESFEDTLAQQQYQAELMEVALSEDRLNEERLNEEFYEDTEISAEEAAAIEIDSQNEGYDLPIDDTEAFIQTDMQNAQEVWENTFNR
jgi:hypothetical protein